MKYRTIAGELADVHPSITPERIIDAVERCMTTLDDPGFCLHCGTDADGCEPDARHYKCDSCGSSPCSAPITAIGPASIELVKPAPERPFVAGDDILRA